MIDLSLKNITKSFGAETVLKDITFDIYSGEKVGLVGKNGCGKSTLLKCLCSEDSFDSGSYIHDPMKKIGYLAQIPVFNSETTVREVLEKGLSEQKKLEERMAFLEHEMSCSPGNVELVREYGEIQNLFELRGGYTSESEMFRISMGLGIPKSMWEIPYNRLSGGEMTRVILAGLLLEKSEIMFLDEPTNHLDLNAIQWLEEYIRTCKSTILVVSHDRYFLDRCTSKTIEISNGIATVYNGNYSFFADLKMQHEAENEKLRSEISKEVQRLSFTSDRMHGWGSGNKRMMKKAFALDRRIERIKKMMPEKSEKTIQLNAHIKNANRSGNDVLVIEHLSKSFGDKQLVSDFNSQVRRCESICIMGSNGTGKTTLLKILLGTDRFFEGSYSWGENIKTAYLPQKVVFEDESHTLIDEVMTKLHMNDLEARNRLALFLFRGDDVFKTISVLSGGEKSRLRLCIILNSNVNLLILDEPTNHLDIYPREWLEDILEDFEGTLIFVSHDRYFIDRFATRIWYFNDQMITDYPGTYKQWCEKQQRELNTRQTKIQSHSTTEKQSFEKRRSPETTRRKIEQSISKTESKITDIDLKIAEINNQMSECGSDYEKLQRLSLEISSLESDSSELYNELDSLMSQLDEINQEG